MKRKFKRKLKLKKNIRLLTKFILVFLLIIFMQNNKYIKSFIKTNGAKYVNEKYVKQYKKENIISTGNQKDNKDKLFFVKEEKSSNPLIYIYNTHQTEKYLTKNSSFKPNVTYVSKYLQEKFNENNLYTIVENRSITDILNLNGWAYGSSYKVSRMFMEDTFKNNETIKYFFDIHRDAGSHNYTTLCLNETCYAKLLFLIGLENPNYIDNQKYAEELSKMINEKVNGLSKGILQKQGKKVNGIYNQDFSPRTMLIEVGGENNTIDEVYNTLNILSDVLIEYINKEISNGN